MNLRHLRTFVLIADAGGIAHASDRLHLSSPAASRQLLALEAEFNLKLFHRIGRRLQLTPQGKDLLERSRLLLAEADSLGERARALKGGDVGLLRIGAPPQVIEALFAPFATRYRRRNPGVDIRLVEDASGNLPTRLEHGDIDVAEMGANDERFLSRPLFPIHALVVVPQAHRFARQAKVDIVDLADEPIALLRHQFPMRGWLDAAFDAANVRPKLLLESAAPHTLVAVAAADYAIAIVQSNVPIHHKGVRTIPLVARGASIGIWSAIAWHPRRFLPPYAQRFIEEFASFAPRANPGRNVIRRAPALPRPKGQGHPRAL